jgi:hypothetical protein
MSDPGVSKEIGDRREFRGIAGAFEARGFEDESAQCAVTTRGRSCNATL